MSNEPTVIHHPPVRAKRKPNAYALFVQKKMQDPEIKALPSRERFGACADLWRQQSSAMNENSRAGGYTAFVSKESKKPEMQALPPKERIRAIAAKWQQNKL